MKKPVKEIKRVIAYMKNQMYDEHTEWTCDDEHDRMREACDVLEQLVQERGSERTR